MQARSSCLFAALIASLLVSCGGGSGGGSAGPAAGNGDISDPASEPVSDPVVPSTPSPPQTPVPESSQPPASTTPVVSFSSSVNGTVTGHNVTFTDTSSPEAASRLWTFGDGTSGTGQTVVHAFAAAGDYVVTLSVTNANGSTSTSKVFPVLPAGVAPTATSEPAKEWIAAHNLARAGTLSGISIIPMPDPPLPALTWSQAAADIAQAYANQCIYAHNPNRSSDGVSRGENIFAGAPGGNAGFTPTAAVKAWGGEYVNYTYATGTCTGVCGHYTQLVRRATIRVGCGQALCTSNSPFNSTKPWNIMVCDYENQVGYTGPNPY